MGGKALQLTPVTTCHQQSLHFHLKSYFSGGQVWTARQWQPQRQSRHRQRQSRPPDAAPPGTPCHKTSNTAYTGAHRTLMDLSTCRQHVTCIHPPSWLERPVGAQISQTRKQGANFDPVTAAPVDVHRHVVSDVHRWTLEGCAWYSVFSRSLWVLNLMQTARLLKNWLWCGWGTWEHICVISSVWGWIVLTVCACLQETCCVLRLKCCMWVKFMGGNWFRGYSALQGWVESASQALPEEPARCKIFGHSDNVQSLWSVFLSFAVFFFFFFSPC